MTALMKPIAIAGLAASLFVGASVQAGELTANAAVNNNYIWRGLTQSINQATVSGGLDYSSDNGVYVGTWASNVEYAPGDPFSYEHDIYAGYAFDFRGFSYDVGYLYYNYDEEAEFDFGEIYGSISYGGFSLSVNLLTNTEADEPVGVNFGFLDSQYVSANYGFEVGNGVEVGLHVGWHNGDFNEAFNGVPRDYFDFNVSVAKSGFSFLVTTTDLPDGGADGLDNDSVKFVVGYSHDFSLWGGE